MELVQIECRCKDCICCETYKGKLFCRAFERESEYFSVEVNKDDFCSNGEKKKTEER